MEKRYFNFIFIILLLSLSGCVQKIKVMYVPPQVATEQNEKAIISELEGQISGDFDTKTNSSQIKQLHDYFQNWMGVRYKYGGHSTQGVDCSGLTQRTYKDLYDLDLPRTVAGQSKDGEQIEKKSLRPGDLVFFKTGRYSRHVGIYLDKNKFIHASRSKGVIQSDLSNSYWRKKYWQAKRYPIVNM